MDLHLMGPIQKPTTPTNVQNKWCQYHKLTSNPGLSVPITPPMWIN